MRQEEEEEGDEGGFEDSNLDVEEFEVRSPSGMKLVYRARPNFSCSGSWGWGVPTPRPNFWSERNLV